MNYSDDEQVEKLKAWWKTYGNAMIVGVVLGLGLLYGGKYWKQHTLEQAVQASMLYDQLIFSSRQHDTDNMKRLGSELTENFKNTPYAGLAALVLSRYSFDAKDAEKAQAQLAWAMDNAREDTVREVARLRLGRILLDTGKIRQALALLEKSPLTGFEFEYFELKGDVLLKSGDKAKARQAYQTALNSGAVAGEYASVVKMKLDNLG